MSAIVFSKSLTPPDELEFSPTENLKFEYFSDLVQIPVAHLFPWPDRDIVNLADARSYRTLNRSGLLLSRALFEDAAKVRQSLQGREERTGIYCALDSGPQDYKSIREAAIADPKNANKILLARTPPKQAFKGGQSFLAAQIAIDWNIRGPLNTYAHGKFGGLHALSQAEFDLAHGVVKRALVLTAFSLEDALQSAKTLSCAPKGMALSEAVGIIVLAPSARKIDWETCLAEINESEENVYYGIANPMVKIIHAFRSKHERGQN